MMHAASPISAAPRPSGASFDCIIVGGGHAGCEAAMALARLGCATLLISSNLDRLGHCSCNPAIGGLAKGHMVREIDALGGMMGLWADEAAIQFRMLNASKGPAVQAPRAQIDRARYMLAVQRDLFACPGLSLTQDMVSSIITQNGRSVGVLCRSGAAYRAPAVCITGGTFLRGMLHIGETGFPGGRMGDEAAESLSQSLAALGIPLRRFMTCTPPRVLTASVNFAAMQIQAGDEPPGSFSFHGPGVVLPQVPCHMTWTTPEAHALIAANLRRSPMYNGDIPGPGPRYCPAIEDKIARFPEKSSHQVFIEPEGLRHPETYCNNLPTGLPLEVQEALLRLIPGLEKSRISRPGYAIQYDCVFSTDLAPTLESKIVPGLWFAGQINGTSGYEEAAAQGLWAALNIACALKSLPPFAPGREQSYIAVLVDDLVTKGTDEPYRMFTSRAEHRLLLREGNADMRLTPLGRKLGLVRDDHWTAFQSKRNTLEALLELLQTTRLTPDARARDIFASLGEPPPSQAVNLGELLRRPRLDLRRLAVFRPEILEFPQTVLEEAQTALRYEGYLTRQEELAQRSAKGADVLLPPDLDYADVAGLTAEAVEKFSRVRPRNLAQAGRIPGITPANLACLDIHLHKLSRAGYRSPRALDT